MTKQVVVNSFIEDEDVICPICGLTLQDKGFYCRWRKAFTCQTCLKKECNEIKYFDCKRMCLHLDKDKSESDKEIQRRRLDWGIKNKFPIRWHLNNLMCLKLKRKE